MEITFTPESRVHLHADTLSTSATAQHTQYLIALLFTRKLRSTGYKQIATINVSYGKNVGCTRTERAQSAEGNHVICDFLFIIMIFEFTITS